MGRFLGDCPSFCSPSVLTAPRAVWIQVLIFYSLAESTKSARASRLTRFGPPRAPRPSLPLSPRSDLERLSSCKVEALNAGADDYLTKPFGVGELLARIRVALRHAARISDEGRETTTFRFGHVRGDLAERRVFFNEEEVKLTKLEFDLLATLVRNPGKVLTHRYLLKEVWGPYAVDEPHYVRVFMANLRKKLERLACHSKTSRPK